MEVINNTQLVLTCRDSIRLNQIPFELTNISSLNQITKFSARGAFGARGPFISIPTNICLLSNLQILDLSFNKLENSSFNISSSCSLFTSLHTLDFSSNYLIDFPINFTSHISSLENVYFQYNQLNDLSIFAFYNIEYLQRLDFSYNNLTSFELWTFLVHISVNYNNNQITKITNQGNINLTNKNTSGTQINLSNNGLINLNDGIYEMYGVCSEVQILLKLNYNDTYIYPWFTLGLYTINFGTTLINCTCDLYYIFNLIPLISGNDFVLNYSLSNALCLDGKTKLIYFNYTNCLTSTMNFTSLIPRLCKINENELGNIPIYIEGQNYTERTTIATSTTSTIINTTSSLNTNISSCITSLSISDTNLMIICSSNINLILLPINNYSLIQLNRITTLTIQGYSNLRGPLITIPPNICFLTNLLVLNLSFNQITYLDSSFFSSNFLCLKKLRKLDLSNNYLIQFPSLFIKEIISLEELYLQFNQLISFDLSLIVLISLKINLSNNQISKIINNANINFSFYNQISSDLYIDLTNNNNQFIDLTDQIYEMYGACYEIQQIININLISKIPLLTNGLLKINFNNTKINCSCNQYYIQQAILSTLNNFTISTYPFLNTMCNDGSLFFQNNKTLTCSMSSVDFSNISPRLCKINLNESGLIPINATDNSTIIISGKYPYYLTQTTNNSYCLYTFYEGGFRVSIDCINGSIVLTEISSVILTNIYFLNITQVIINNENPISKFPSFLCFLPSMTIDLSNQSFYVLDRNTFPCLANTTLRYINFAYNQITFVNLTLTNWILINLISNNLSQFPYSLFYTNDQQSRTSSIQQILRLSSNNLTEFDLFIYTYSNIQIDLQNNPFLKSSNGYNIIRNIQKQSLNNQSLTTTTITFSNQLYFLINDLIAQNYNACERKSFAVLFQIFELMKEDGLIIEIECQCSSFYLKEYYRLLNSSVFITDKYQCSNTSSLNETNFESLTVSICSSSLVLSSDRLCQFSNLNEDSSLSNTLKSNESNPLLAVILGSVLSSIGVLLLIGIIVLGIYLKRRLSPDTLHSTRDHFEERSGNFSWLDDLPSADVTTSQL